MKKKAQNGGSFGDLDLIFKQMGKSPLLDKDEEVRLLKRIELNGVRGEKARSDFVYANMGIVTTIAKRYTHRAEGMSFADLVQHGLRGLIKSTDKFDWRMGFKFSTYAFKGVDREIRNAIRKQRRLRNSPSQPHYAAISSVMSKFFQKHGRRPTFLELAKALKVNVRDYVEREKLECAVRSIEGGLGLVSLDSAQDLSERSGSVRDMKAVRPIDDVVARDRKFLLETRMATALNILSPREIEILSMHFGIGYAWPLTHQEISEKVHPRITRQRVMQIEEVALGKLRANPEVMDMLAKYFYPKQEE